MTVPSTVARPRVSTLYAQPTRTLAPAPVRSGSGSARRAAVSRTPRRSCAKIGTLTRTPGPRPPFGEPVNIALEASTDERGRLMLPLRDVARDALAQGYDKNALIEDFERVRARLDEGGEEECEDAVMEVMDFLYGWCSPHMKL